MSAHLAQLMGKSSSELGILLEKLESLSGFNSIDNHLLSEIRAKLWPKISELGLDPLDTTPTELYHANQARYMADNQLFGNLLNGSQSDIDSENYKIVHLLDLTGVGGESWVLKRKVAKDIVALNKPVKLQKYLNYRSITSMLKREDIGEIFAALPLIESRAWLNKFNKDLQKIKPSDFELRQISPVVMKTDRWSIIKPSRSVTVIDLLGNVILWPRETKNSGLSTFIKSISAVETISLNNLALMDSQVKPDFAKYLSDYLSNRKASSNNSVFGLDWHNLAHYYSHLPTDLNPFVAEPHMQNIKMLKFSPAKIVSALHPVLRWWEGNDYLGVGTSAGAVSLNLSDAANNFSHYRDFTDKSFRHLKASLWNELTARYMSHPAFEQEVLNKFAKTTYEYEMPPQDMNFNNLQKRLLQTA